MNLENRLKYWLHLGILIPVGILLLTGNICFWNAHIDKHERFLTELLSTNAESLDQVLFSYAIRMHSLAHMPSTTSLMAARERSRREMMGRQLMSKGLPLEEVWSELSTDELAVREVVDNNVGEIFQQLCMADDFLEQLLLTDGEGRILAASQKPDLYNFRGTPWWQAARSETADIVVGEQISQLGKLNLSVAVSRPGVLRAVQGILRAKLNMTAIFQNVTQTTKGGEAILLKDPNNLLPPGADNDYAAMVTQLDEDDLAGGSGWRDGVRFHTRKINAQIAWPVPLWLIAVQREDRYPLALYGMPTGVAAGSILLFIFTCVFFHNFVRRHFITPAEELLLAGDWALQNALGRDSALSSVTTDHGSAESSSKIRIRKDLETWLQRFRQALKDEVSTRTTEMERDLNLAKDFQRAMLERPYPVIPDLHIPGRLRLNFFHKYDPASVLGGDFFDILKLGPDSGGVFIADVMGHGTRSALITAILRALIGDLIQQGRNAPHFLTGMNRQFCDLLESVPNPLFASAFYFVADTTAHVATFSTAGHPAPFLMRRSLGRISRLEVPAPRGAALGVIPDETFTGAHCRLLSEDIFIFFTDGLFETFNRKGEEFGINRVEKSLRRLMYKSAEEIVNGLIEDVIEFADDEPIADDICIIAAEVTTRAADDPADS